MGIRSPNNARLALPFNTFRGGSMKRWFLVILLVPLLLMACEPVVQTPAPDVPKYTADQVIYVAQASSIWRNNSSFRVTAEYDGNGLWKVIAYWGAGHEQTGYFTEWDGKMTWN